MDNISNKPTNRSDNIDRVDESRPRGADIPQDFTALPRVSETATEARQAADGPNVNPYRDVANARASELERDVSSESSFSSESSASWGDTSRASSLSVSIGTHSSFNALDVSSQKPKDIAHYKTLPLTHQAIASQTEHYWQASDTVRQIVDTVATLSDTLRTLPESEIAKTGAQGVAYGPRYLLEGIINDHINGCSPHDVMSQTLKRLKSDDLIDNAIKHRGYDETRNTGRKQLSKALSSFIQRQARAEPSTAPQSHYALSELLTTLEHGLGNIKESSKRAQLAKLSQLFDRAANTLNKHSSTPSLPPKRVPPVQSWASEAIRHQGASVAVVADHISTEPHTLENTSSLTNALTQAYETADLNLEKSGKYKLASLIECDTTIIERLIEDHRTNRDVDVGFTTYQLTTHRLASIQYAQNELNLSPEQSIQRELDLAQEQLAQHQDAKQSISIELNMPSLNLTGSAAWPAGRSLAKQVIINTGLNTEYGSDLTLRERQESLNHYEALYRELRSRWASEGRGSDTDTVRRQGSPSAPRRANQEQPTQRDETPTPPRRGRR